MSKSQNCKVTIVNLETVCSIIYRGDEDREEVKTFGAYLRQCGV